MSQLPEHCDFSSLNRGIGRSDDNYQIAGSVTAQNGLKIEVKTPISVRFVAGDDSFTLHGISLNGLRVK